MRQHDFVLLLISTHKRHANLSATEVYTLFKFFAFGSHVPVLSFTLARMRKHAVVFFLLLAARNLAASDSPPRWLEIHSAHFDVLTDDSERQARHVAAQLEQMRTVFRTLIPHPEDDGPPIIVLALKDRKSFQSLEPSAYLAKNQLDLSGIFLRAPDKNYILLRLDAEGTHPFSAIYHEYTHFILSKSQWLPLWLNEGLAEFYQNTDIRQKEALLGQGSTDDILFLRRTPLLPLATLFAVDYTSPYYHDEQKGSIFYSESWALTHFLIFNDREKDTDHLHDYAVALNHNEDPVTAAQHAFGDLKLLQKQLEAYIQQSSFSLFKVSVAATVDESTLHAIPLPTPDADAIRADVLVFNNRQKEAAALLDTVLREDPKNARAHETMGYLKFSGGDLQAARQWYTEAVQLDSHSYLAHYYFAVMSMQADSATLPEAIEASLLASIKLNPDFAPSYDALAQFYAMHHEKLEDAHLLNLHAIQLEPENFSYRLSAAQVLIEAQQFPDAIDILKSAEKLAKNPAELATVQQRIAQLAVYEADVAQYKDLQAHVHGASMTAAPTSETDQRPVLTAHTTDPTHHPDVLGDPPESTGAPNYPTEPLLGFRHIVTGTLQNVHCFYPAILTLDVVHARRKVSIYTNDYFKIPFTTTFPSTGEIKPCSAIAGMKARVVYAEVTDKRIAGQIVSMELSK